MPKIPQYSSQSSLVAGKLTRETPTIQVSPQDFAAGGRAMSEMGKVVAEVGERMYLLQAKEETYRAGTASIKSRNQALQDASQDTETSNEDFLGTYSKRFADDKEAISQTIRNPLAQKQFSLEYDRDVLNSQFKLKNLHNRRVAESMISSFAEESVAKKKEFYAGTPDEKTRVLGWAAAEFKEIAAITGNNDALVNFQKFKEDLRTGQVEHDLHNNPELTEQLINKGAYKLTGVEKEKYLKEINTIQKRAKVDLETKRVDALVENRINVVSSIASGELTWIEAIKNLNEYAAQDPELAEAIQKNLEIGKFELDDEKKNEAFMQFAEDIFLADDKENMSDFMVTALKNKSITRDRLGALVYAAKMRSKELNGVEEKGFWGSLWSFFKNAPVKNTVQSAALFKTLTRANENPDTNEEEIMQVAKEEINKEQAKVESQMVKVRYKPTGAQAIIPEDKFNAEIWEKIE